MDYYRVLVCPFEAVEGTLTCKRSYVTNGRQQLFAGFFVAMSPLSLCQSISNDKDFILLHTEEIKRLERQTRADVCQRSQRNVLRVSAAFPVCLCESRHTHTNAACLCHWINGINSICVV